MKIIQSKSKNILGIDPGTDQSGFAVYDPEGRRVLRSGVRANAEIYGEIHSPDIGHVAIEMIASYGMAVGREVFETCLWIGRFSRECERTGIDHSFVFRKDAKLHFCGSTKAKDANIRQAILDQFERSGGGKTPQIGTKSNPGPLYGVSSHAWPALAVAMLESTRGYL